MGTYMWGTAPSTFRIQTDDPNAAKKLSRRRRPILVGYGVNKYLRIYELRDIRRQNAVRTLKYVTGHKIKKNPETGEYEA